MASLDPSVTITSDMYQPSFPREPVNSIVVMGVVLSILTVVFFVSSVFPALSVEL